MSRNPSSNTDNKVYVGDLGNNASKGELEDSFSYYGRLRSVWVARNPPGFAFIEFEDPRDAEDAVRGLDGRSVCGRRVRVELSTGRSRSRGFSGPSRRGRPFHPEDRCYECGSRGHYARDCPLSGSKSHSRSRSRSRTRSRSRSRSRSLDRRSRSRSVNRRNSRSRSRSRSRSPADRRSRSKSVSRHRSKDRSRSRSARNRVRSKSRSRERSVSDSRSRSRARSVSPRTNGDA